MFLSLPITTEDFYRLTANTLIVKSKNEFATTFNYMKKTSDKYRAGYKTGEMVWLDGDLSNRSLVKVIRQTPRRIYTTVEAEGVQWDVMTYRLSR